MRFDSVFFFVLLLAQQNQQCFNSLLEFIIKYQEIEWKLKGNIKKNNTKKSFFFSKRIVLKIINRMRWE